MEAAWRSLKFLVERTNFKKNVKLDILDVSKDELAEDFEDAPETIQSGLYKHVYVSEYDTPGGEPYGAVVSNYQFDSGPSDITLLQNVSKVSAACHCPSSIGQPEILRQGNHPGPHQDRGPAQLYGTLRVPQMEFLPPDRRCPLCGLMLPRVMLRLPYGPETQPVKEFNYTENVKGLDHDKYLWGNASFAFAANMVRSYVENGWCVQIRGPEAGGKVEDLPVHIYDVGKGSQMKDSHRNPHPRNP